VDWKNFLDSYHVPYVERGSNVTRNNISIACPFCQDDPSEHLGISLVNGYWNCWRDERHRGRSPVRLIQALIRCSRLEAESIADTKNLIPLNSFDAVIASLSHQATDTETKRDWVRFPPNVKVLVDKGMGRRFIDYLVDRDYTRDEARSLCEVYNLMYAIQGPFAYRVIIPVEMEEGIVTWTGRDITSTSDIRYKSLSVEESKRSIKECLFGYKSLVEDNNSHTLLICEGPFDAMRTDFFGYQFGIRATCLFGVTASDAQVALISRIANKFEHRWCCLDAGAKLLNLHLRFKLTFLNFGMLAVPEPYKDPGELPKDVMHNWFEEINRLNLL
jgi:hypothetical protein